jgi:HEAT repeat protein
MKYFKIVPIIIILMISAGSMPAQDVRLIATKVADLLAQMPSKDNSYTEKLMNDMLSLGDAGIRQICDQIVPVGSGNDTGARFAVESFSRFLSKPGKEQEKLNWEKMCLGYVADRKDFTVKDFFMKQLQLTGSDISVEALKIYLADKDLSAPAVAVIGAVGGKQAEKVLSESLKDKNLPCAASVMNILAVMKSEIAVNEFIVWASSADKNIKAAAYNAMAKSGNPLAFPVLSKAARDAKYGWEHTGATEAFLNYARAAGDKGDVKAMDKVCKAVIDGSKDRNSIQYKTEALCIKVNYYGYEAMPDILAALGSSDKSYRNSALMFSLSLQGQPVTRKLIGFYPKAAPDVRPEIIRNLASRKDELSVPLVTSSLSDQDVNVRKEAASALVSLSGQDAVPSLIEYIVRSTGSDDQEAAKSALMTVLDSKRMHLLLPALKDSPNQGKKSILELLAWSRDKKFFQIVFPYTSFDDEGVRSASFRAMSDLSSPSDQDKLIELLGKTDNGSYVADIQLALANAANQISDPEERPVTILKALDQFKQKEKLIPVLAMTGGRKALSAVLSEFENGSTEMRSTCFKALSSWKDYSASSALYEICASGNKNYGSQAFDGYVKQVKSAPVTDDQRLLLYRKIMPFALDPDKKNQIIVELGKIKTYPSIFFAAKYLDDPLTCAAAAKAVMYIALPNTGSKAGMYGILVREILSKAVPMLKGPESEYDKELVNKYLASMSSDDGFIPMFNGKDLTGWQGLVENPVTRAKMKPAELAKKQAEANKKMTENWSVRDGCIWFSGNGDNLCSIKDYTDFEMYVDWKITKKGDSGIYLRGSPQIQIWDTSRVEAGAQVGSGGLYNNQKNRDKPLVVADNPIDDWNTFRIIMVGEQVSVWLNGILVVDNIVLENYWDRSIPIFSKGAIELQAHGNELAFRDIYVREINEKEFNLTSEEKAEGFISLFNGRNIDNWVGDKEAYAAEDGMIVVKPDKGKVGNLYTENEYSDFIYRFEFQLTPAANNGLGIRAPLEGDAAYVGMELQILDDNAPVYANLQPYQYHGSVYGVIPSRRGYLKPLGEWNAEEVFATGTHIRITLNGTVIVDGDIAGPRDNGTMDHNNHPGLKNKTGHIGFLGHGSVVKFRNIRIKDLSK